jgi:hypothetical protein
MIAGIKGTMCHGLRWHIGARSHGQIAVDMTVNATSATIARG